MSENLIQVVNDEILTTSLLVAEKFKKDHRNVTRKIDALMSDIEGIVNFAHTPLFEKSELMNEQNGQTYPVYYMNRDGFTLLAMGFTGKTALEWKLKYIEAFNAMEKKLHTAPAADNRLAIAKLIVKTSDRKLNAIRELYPEYFSSAPGSLEYHSDINTAYQNWIADYGITSDWISDFPTTEIFLNYVRYCTENHAPSMGKKIFYRTLEYDFNLTRKQSTDGKRYFLTA